MVEVNIVLAMIGGGVVMGGISLLLKIVYSWLDRRNIDYERYTRQRLDDIYDMVVGINGRVRLNEGDIIKLQTLQREQEKDINRIGDKYRKMEDRIKV